MRGMEEHQLTFDETPIKSIEVIITDAWGGRHVLVLRDTVQRHITAQIATRREVDALPGYLTAPTEKVGMASATIHLTGMVQEQHMDDPEVPA